MGKVVKLSVSLPEDLFEAAERGRRARRETRSAFFRRALETFVRREQEKEAVERYVRGYAAHPETDADVAAANAMATAALAEEPWE